MSDDYPTLTVFPGDIVRMRAGRRAFARLVVASYEDCEGIEWVLLVGDAGVYTRGPFGVNNWQRSAA